MYVNGVFGDAARILVDIRAAVGWGLPHLETERWFVVVGQDPPYLPWFCKNTVRHQ